MKKTLIQILFMVLVASLTVQALMYKASEDELCNQSNTIVIGKVISAESRWDSDYRKIYTFVTFAVDERLKGKSIGNAITVRLPGGEVGEIGMSVSDITPMKSGDENVLFLRQIDDSDMYVLTGKNQGKYRIITNQETQEKLVTRSLFSYTENGSKKLGEIKSTDFSGSSDTEKLSVFKQRIADILQRNE